MATNQIESLCSPVRPICVLRTGGHSEPNITRTGGSAMHRRWLGSLLQSCEQPVTCANSCAGMAQVLATIGAQQGARSVPMKKPVLSAVEGAA